MDIEFLYRGFNCYMDLEKALTPKSVGSSIKSEAECGDEWIQCGDSDFTCGSSLANTIHFHEYSGNGRDTCGISSSPIFDIAKNYALGGGKFENGTVVMFSTALLQEYDVKIVSVNQILDKPCNPQDDEHWLCCKGVIPEEAIVEQIEVSL